MVAVSKGYCFFFLPVTIKARLDWDQVHDRHDIKRKTEDTKATMDEYLSWGLICLVRLIVLISLFIIVT